MYHLTIEPGKSSEVYTHSIQEVFRFIDGYVCSNCKKTHTESVKEVTASYNANPSNYNDQTLEDVLDRECYDALPDEYEMFPIEQQVSFLLGTSCGCELTLREV